MHCKLLVLAVVSTWPVPALADDRSDCLAGKGEIGILACSNLIARDHNDAVAYHHRGIAAQATGDLDRALADYTRAIELKPTYGPAYESRARAYTVKGDYERAVADVTMFVELTAKPAGGAQVTTSSKRAAKQPGKLAPRAKPDVPAEEPPLDDWPEWAPKP